MARPQSRRQVEERRDRNIASTNGPVRTFTPVARVRGRSGNQVNTSALSRSLLRLTGTLRRNEAIGDNEDFERGVLAAQEASRANEEGFAKAAGMGLIDETESPHYVKGYIEQASRDFIRRYRDNVSNRLDEALQIGSEIDPETGLPKPAKSIREIRNEVWEELTGAVAERRNGGIFNTFHGRRTLSEGRFQIDQALESKAQEGYKRNLAKHHRAYASRDIIDSVQAIFNAGVNKDGGWTFDKGSVEQLSSMIDERVRLRSIKDPDKLAMAAVETAILDIAGKDDAGPEAALSFLDTVRSLKVEGIELDKNADFSARIERIEATLQADIEAEEDSSLRDRQIKVKESIIDARAKHIQNLMDAAQKGPSQLESVFSSIYKAVSGANEGVGEYGDATGEVLLELENLRRSLKSGSFDDRQARLDFHHAMRSGDIEAAEAVLPQLGPEALPGAINQLDGARQITNWTEGYQPYRDTLRDLEGLQKEIVSVATAANSAQRASAERRANEVLGGMRKEYRDYALEVRNEPNADQLMSAKLNELRERNRQTLTDLRGEFVEPYQNLTRGLFDANTKLTDFSETVTQALRDGVIGPEQAEAMIQSNRQVLERAQAQGRGPVVNQAVTDLLQVFDSSQTEEVNALRSVETEEGLDGPAQPSQSYLEARQDLRKEVEQFSQEWWSSKAATVPAHLRSVVFRNDLNRKVQELAAPFRTSTSQAVRDAANSDESAAEVVKSVRVMQASVDLQNSIRSQITAARSYDSLVDPATGKSLIVDSDTARWVQRQGSVGASFAGGKTFDHNARTLRLLRNVAEGGKDKVRLRKRAEEAYKHQMSRVMTTKKSWLGQAQRDTAYLHYRQFLGIPWRSVLSGKAEVPSYRGKGGGVVNVDPARINSAITPLFSSKEELSQFFDYANTPEGDKDLRKLLTALKVPFDESKDDLSEDDNVQLWISLQENAISRITG